MQTITITKKTLHSPNNLTDMTVGKPYVVIATSHAVPKAVQFMVIDDAKDEHWVTYTDTILLNNHDVEKALRD